MSSLQSTGQRLRALNWLCGFGSSWDDVPLDIEVDAFVSATRLQCSSFDNYDIRYLSNYQEAQPMDATRLEDLSLLFKALADPARLRILGLLAERPLAGHELADRLALTPPTISHHMRRLVAARLVDVVPDAQSRIYSLRTDAIRELSRVGAG